MLRLISSKKDLNSFEALNDKKYFIYSSEKSTKHLVCFTCPEESIFELLYVNKNLLDLGDISA